MHHGLFVTFEGVEGAGKTTQIALLAEALRGLGHTVLLTREPGGDHVAEAVRNLVLHHDISPRAELLLFLAARSQNVHNVVMPALERGEVVICDRFIDSSVAYQGFGRGLGRDVVANLNRFATADLVPDVTVLLDLEPEIGLSRQSDRNRMEAESLDFHKRVRAGFLHEAQNSTERFVVIDGSAERQDVHERIMQRVTATIAARAGRNSVSPQTESVASQDN